MTALTIPARHPNARRQYRIWPLEFTPDPGPRRLYGERPPSRIKSILIDYVDESGVETEVARIEVPGDEIALIRAASNAAVDHFAQSRVGGRYDLVSVPASILEKLRTPVSPEYAREMSRNDNS